jgi:hypothetical protein
MDGALTRMRPRADYTVAEQSFSRFLSERVAEVLEGKRNRLQVLRKHPGDPRRVGVLAPRNGHSTQLRAAVAERLTWDVIRFVQVDTNGGPIAQTMAPDGAVLEVQTFPTRFPHIVIERVDRFVAGASVADEITWSLYRVQNQRAQTQVNRVLDAANLLFELVRLVR